MKRGECSLNLTHSLVRFRYGNKFILQLRFDGQRSVESVRSFVSLTSDYEIVQVLTVVKKYLPSAEAAKSTVRHTQTFDVSSNFPQTVEIFETYQITRRSGHTWSLLFAAANSISEELGGAEFYLSQVGPLSKYQNEKNCFRQAWRMLSSLFRSLRRVRFEPVSEFRK